MSYYNSNITQLKGNPELYNNNCKTIIGEQDDLYQSVKVSPPKSPVHNLVDPLSELNLSEGIYFFEHSVLMVIINFL